MLIFSSTLSQPSTPSNSTRAEIPAPTCNTVEVDGPPETAPLKGIIEEVKLDSVIAIEGLDPR